jgi:hypothetical protein
MQICRYRSASSRIQCDIGRELFPDVSLPPRIAPERALDSASHQSDALVLRQGEVPADGWLWVGCIGVTKITFLNTRNRSVYQMVTETMRDLGKDGGPSSATFEHANTITKFIQRFGTRVEMNLGKPIFSALAALALVVAFVHGMPPIGILEVLLWCALAALWTTKNWRDERLNYALLAFAALVFVGEGYALGKDTAQSKSFFSSFDGVPGTPQVAPQQPIENEPAEEHQKKTVRDLVDCYQDHKRNPTACDDPEVILQYTKRAKANP